MITVYCGATAAFPGPDLIRYSTYNAINKLNERHAFGSRNPIANYKFGGPGYRTAPSSVVSGSVIPNLGNRGTKYHFN